MRRALTIAGACAVLTTSLVIAGPSAVAQDSPGDFDPISIYSLDGGSLEDSIGDASLVTDAGTAYGNPVPTEDRHGNANGALLFDGVDDYIQTNEVSNINPLTFSVWFRADDISDEHSIVDSDASGAYGHSLIIGYDDPGNDDDTPRDGSLDVQYHNAFWDTGVKIEEGAWTHAFVTYSDDEMKLYVGSQTEEPKLVAEQPYDTSVGFDGSNFRFGRHNDDDPQWFKGALDDIRFYDKALTPDEIVEVAEAPTDEPSESTDAPIVPATFGDVHISTPDGLVYDFQVTGEYVLTQDTTGDVLVWARQESSESNPKVSLNTAAVLSVAGDDLEFGVKPEQYLVLNGVDTPLPTSDLTLPNGGTIRRTFNVDRPDFTIIWPDGNTGARVVQYGTSHIDIGVARLGGNLTYEGVLGNLDRDATNDIQIRGGEAVTPPASAEQLVSFADSWRVTSAESPFKEPLPDPAPLEPELPVTLADLDATAVEEAETTCADAGITDPLALDNCTYDVAATGDEIFVQTAEVYQEAVQARPEAITLVAALEGQEEPEQSPPPAAAADDDEGMSPIVFVGIGLVVLVIVAAVFLISRKGKQE